MFVKKGDTADLYVRINNSTRLLNTADAVDYIAARWRLTAIAPLPQGLDRRP